MGMKVYHIFLLFAAILYFITLNLALTKTRKFIVDGYMKYFFLYPLVGFMVSVLFWLKFFGMFPVAPFSIINKLSILFHFAFLSVFMLKIIRKKTFFYFVSVSFFLLVTFLVYIDIINRTKLAIPIANACLFILCLFYFHNLFTAPPTLNLSREPSFWICCGILLGSGFLIPLYVFNLSFFKITIDPNLSHILGTLFGFGYAIMYLFFIKAYLCIQTRLE